MSRPIPKQKQPDHGFWKDCRKPYQFYSHTSIPNLSGFMIRQRPPMAVLETLEGKEIYVHLDWIKSTSQ